MKNPFLPNARTNNSKANFEHNAGGGNYFIEDYHISKDIQTRNLKATSISGANIYGVVVSGATLIPTNVTSEGILKMSNENPKRIIKADGLSHYYSQAGATIDVQLSIGNIIINSTEDNGVFDDYISMNDDFDGTQWHLYIYEGQLFVEQEV